MSKKHIQLIEGVEIVEEGGRYDENDEPLSEKDLAKLKRKHGAIQKYKNTYLEKKGVIEWTDESSMFAVITDQDGNRYVANAEDFDDEEFWEVVEVGMKVRFQGNHDKSASRIDIMPSE